MGIELHVVCSVGAVGAREREPQPVDQTLDTVNFNKTLRVDGLLKLHKQVERTRLLEQGLHHAFKTPTGLLHVDVRKDVIAPLGQPTAHEPPA